ISLDKLEECGDLKCYDLTKKDEIIPRIKNADIIITNKVVIGKEEMEAAKNLKLICVAATGYNNIDIKEANKREIKVLNVKGYSTRSVAQTVFSYMLEFENKINKYDKAVKSGRWEKSDFFTMLDYPINELSSKKLGIIGFGNIGKKVKKIAQAFEMDVLVAKRPGAIYSDDFRVSFNKVLKESDILTIHTPLTDETFDMISKKEFEIMKNDAILINTARGNIVNEDDLYFALKNKKIRGAAIDVMEEEPPKEYKKLFKLSNIRVTPHIAWASITSRKKLLEGIIKNIKDYNNKNIKGITG
ncbi:MAG: D-2-hydroxyacid dehydrogenase, partial [Fusobacteriota bacterium]